MEEATMGNGNKTALITGANAGLGKEIARQLAVGGEFSKIYLACRNEEKALAAKEDLEQVTEKMIFEIIIMDVSKPDSVRTAASSLDHAIDVLIMNAGGVGGGTALQLTPEGVTEMFATNLLGHVVLLDELLKAKKLTSAAVFLGSEAARGVWQLGIQSPVFESYSAEEFSSVCDGTFFAGKQADPMLVYGQVKYLAAMWMSSVARKHPDLKLITVSPGNTKGTDASNHVAWPLRLLIQYLLFPIVMPLFGMVHNLEIGAARIVDSLGDASIESGKFYASPDGKLIGPLVDQSTIRPEMNNEEYQENASRAVHQFIAAALSDEEEIAPNDRPDAKAGAQPWRKTASASNATTASTTPQNKPSNPPSPGRSRHSIMPAPTKHGKDDPLKKDESWKQLRK